MEATKVKDLTGWQGNAALYRLSESYDVQGYDPETGEYGTIATVDHVAVSAVRAPFTGAETFIFPTTEDGTVVDWGELPGSQRGTLDHDAVIADFLAVV